ncbi:hypothetical protein HYPSUDRAFT_203477 [Hypholoma sublateritium FD-334 SS-4]|uniref:Uncharacterized protein n=1 Tax=Hypholoma sublateritium (strain FD-334 SS-4) TaxID=945553 RepID=A0A0D2L2G3_HYPSF|nr:hypothetical protein HYPSUDRAFT_203477 [Hypholoma sublateritium FD-334 SS-4]
MRATRFGHAPGPLTIPQKPNYPISFLSPVTLVTVTMSWFSGLDSPAPGYESPSSSSNTQLALHHVSTVLLSLANSAETSIETNLGLSESALIALDIIEIAQHAKSYRKLCADIADQTYQLLNAVDGGIKGRAIDVNFILRDHIRRLNEDLLHIRKLLKCFSVWWNLARLWKAPQRLQKCYDILAHAMQMYLLLLRCSLDQPPGSRRSSPRKKWRTIPSAALGRQPAAASNLACSRPKRVTKAAPRLVKSVSQPPHSPNRTFSTDAF